MHRFRQLLILSSLWIMTVLGIERLTERIDFIAPYFYDINIDTFVYLGIFSLVILLLLYPDFAKHIRWVYAGVIIGYFGIKISIESTLELADAPSIAVELLLLLSTIIIFRQVSLALVNFEQVVENILIKPNNLNVFNHAEGVKEIDDELFRARRFDRNISFLRVHTGLITNQTKNFNIAGIMQQKYYQYQIAGIVRSLTYKSDILVWDEDDLVVCLPETNKSESIPLAAKIYRQVKIRHNIKLPIGVATFPENGLIYADLATVAQTNFIIQDIPDDALSMQGQLRQTAELEAINLQASNDSIANALYVKPQPLLQKMQYTMHDIFNPLPSFELSSGVLSLKQTDLNNPDFWVYNTPTQSIAAKETYYIFKRLIDIVLVLASMPLVLPVFLIVALAIYLTDGGNIFFVQERTGLGGQRFKMYKFRTMVVNAEAKLKELAEQGLAKLDADGKLAEPLKLKHDPRITRVGRLLRKSSLDELPQLFNVLRGDMSIVGPRPTSWSVKSYTLMQTERLSVRPGITGLWQVCARGDTDFNDWVEWDMAYIDRSCLWLDMRIIFETVAQVLKTRGAR
jgi:lipopolysaccharide/colanic/teichoic acid biosynthesis glycosyltransferase